MDYFTTGFYLSTKPLSWKTEKMKPENVKCPECGGEMISRTGKFGVFWGCKDFPNCRGTRDSMGRSKQDREEWKAKQEAEQSEATSSERAKFSFDKFKKRADDD
ncbi:topoisomerase DNA-binding C4 zinc finger domain-containing protein [Candidatus Pacearchaeota archaeon]|nr:topoisomerase DNA-binding C4 zinc finger domain-containing protein [Candidatus Pacearchaeota archaeon]